LNVAGHGQLGEGLAQVSQVMGSRLIRHHHRDRGGRQRGAAIELERHVVLDDLRVAIEPTREGSLPTFDDDLATSSAISASGLMADDHGRALLVFSAKESR
jgi:hypothetical protein